MANLLIYNYRKHKIHKIHEIEQSEGFLGRFLGPLLKTGLPFIGNLLKALAKSN